MDTPKFVGVVVDGNGKVLHTITGDQKADVRQKTLGRWADEQVRWTERKSKQDPPMWDFYARSGRATPRK